jgi:hypothetical protein
MQFPLLEICSCILQTQKSRFDLNAPRVHSDTPHSVGLIWTNDLPIAEACTYTAHNIHKRQTSIPPAGFEPRNPSKPATGSADNILPDHKFHEQASDYSACVIT